MRTSNRARISRPLAFACVVGLLGCSDEETPTGPSQTAPVYAACGNSPDYLNQGNAPYRWRSFPITIYFDLTNAPHVNEPGYREIYERALWNGMSSWSAAGNGIGQLTKVTSAAGARIVVSFGNPMIPTAAAEGGVTAQDSGNFPSAGIVIFSINHWAPITNKASLETSLVKVARHEIGHVILMMGHSPYAGDVMNAAPGSALTVRDLNSIRNLYCQPNWHPRDEGAGSGPGSVRADSGDRL